MIFHCIAIESFLGSGTTSNEEPNACLLVGGICVRSGDDIGLVVRVREDGEVVEPGAGDSVSTNVGERHGYENEVYGIGKAGNLRAPG